MRRGPRSVSRTWWVVFFGSVLGSTSAEGSSLVSADQVRIPPVSGAIVRFDRDQAPSPFDLMHMVSPPLDAVPGHEPAISDGGSVDVRKRMLPRSIDESLRIGFEPGIPKLFQELLPPDQPRRPAGYWTFSEPEQEAPKVLPRVETRTRTVPEPASIVLLTTGILGLLARRHLLRKRANVPPRT
jgi:PEP-CTERM motif